MVQIEFTATTPFAGGQDFGAGAYERATGIARGALDPTAAANAGIVDLALAPRNAAGLVEWSTEIALLRPTNAARRNGRLVVDITNRGRKRVFGSLYDGTGDIATMNALESPASVGNAMPLSAGTSFFWHGWDPETPRANGNLRLSLPILEGITGPCRDEFVFGTRITPADRPSAPLSYPAVLAAGGRLTVRRTQEDPRREVPFSFVGERAIAVEGGFERGSIYEFHYTATGARPLGMGLAATRDLVAALRTQEAARCVVGLGISQSGRFLRHFLGLGLNQALDGARVFDGVFSHVGGAGRVFMNQRFAQPDRTGCWHEDRDFPEVWAPMALPADVSGVKVMQSNSSTEYWQKGACLIHTTPDGSADLSDPATSRHYLIAGTKHAASAGGSTAKGIGTNTNNPHNPGPALRALLEALFQWCEAGVAPPESRVPRLADATLVPAAQVLARFAGRGLALPRFASAAAEITDWVNAKRGPDMPALVAAVDADGNELAGVRLPDLAVPRGTYTGWNTYAAPGLGGEQADREGTFLAFPPERLAALYPTPAAYVAAVRAAAEALGRDRLLLAEDVAAFITRAEREGPVPPA